MEFPKMQNMMAATGAEHMLGGEGIAILLGLMIGGVSFAGSMIAFASGSGVPNLERRGTNPQHTARKRS